MDEISTETDIFGTKRWYLNDELHRVDGPAIECANGTKYWCLNGKLHRIDGPAIECADGTKFWYLNGKHHRVDGPAIECADGTKSWYLNSIEILEKDFVIKTKDPILDAINLLKSNGYKVFKEKVELEEV